MFELVDNEPQSAVIKVIGVGGGGGNAVEHMVSQNIEGVDFICANTDAQALQNLSSSTLLQLGTSITKGLGAGADPVMGKDAAEEDRDCIAEVLHGVANSICKNSRRHDFSCCRFHKIKVQRRITI